MSDRNLWCQQCDQRVTAAQATNCKSPFCKAQDTVQTSVPPPSIVRREAMKTKTLDDVKRDMSELYAEVRAGTTDLKVAAELANITGKYLKAEQLKLAREIFEASPSSSAPKQIVDAA